MRADSALIAAGARCCRPMSFHIRDRGLPGHLTWVGDLKLANLEGNPVKDRRLSARLRRELDEESWSFLAHRSTGDLPTAVQDARPPPAAPDPLSSLWERPPKTERELAVYPYFVQGGRKAVAPGIVLPPGMLIRHPSLLAAEKFNTLLKEFLCVWDTSPPGPQQDALSESIQRLWLVFGKFRNWAKFAYGKNRGRALILAESPIRIACHCPTGVLVDVKLSPLATGLELKKKLATIRRAKCSHAMRRPRQVELVHESTVIDDRQTLLDAGVRERSTLTVSLVPNYATEPLDEGAPAGPAQIEKNLRAAAAALPGRYPGDSGSGSAYFKPP